MEKRTIKWHGEEAVLIFEHVSHTRRSIDLQFAVRKEWGVILLDFQFWVSETMKYSQLDTKWMYLGNLQIDKILELSDSPTIVPTPQINTELPQLHC